MPGRAAEHQLKLAREAKKMWTEYVEQAEKVAHLAAQLDGAADKLKAPNVAVKSATEVVQRGTAKTLRWADFAVRQGKMMLQQAEIWEEAFD